MTESERIEYSDQILKDIIEAIESWTEWRGPDDYRDLLRSYKARLNTPPAKYTDSEAYALVAFDVAARRYGPKTIRDSLGVTEEELAVCRALESLGPITDQRGVVEATRIGLPILRSLTEVSMEHLDGFWWASLYETLYMASTSSWNDDQDLWIEGFKSNIDILLTRLFEVRDGTH